MSSSKKRKISETSRGSSLNLRNRTIEPTLLTSMWVNDHNRRDTTMMTSRQAMGVTVEEQDEEEDEDEEEEESLAYVEETVPKEEPWEHAKIQTSMEHASKMMGILNSMRKTPNLCDYEIRVNGEVIPCHKNLLMAVSDFFRVMLTGSMKESRENFVVLKGFPAPNGVKSIIEYIYSGNITLTDNNVLLILSAAHQLQCEEVIKLCSQFLYQQVTTSNCVSILKLADTYVLDIVYQRCTKYLIEHLFAVYRFAPDQFAQLSVEQLEIVLNNEALYVKSELDLFTLVVKWLEMSTEVDRYGKFALRLMKCIRFMCISAEELVDVVEKVEFMKSIPECYEMLVNAFKYHAMPRRQPLIQDKQTKLRNREMLVSIGETSLFLLNETNQMWETLCPAPLEDNYPYPFSVLTINNYLYVIGSRRISSDEYKVCHRFNPRTLEWTPLSPLLHDRSRFGLAVVGNYIYIFGGFEGFKRSNRVYLDTIERYSTVDDKWEPFTELASPLISSVASCSHVDGEYSGIYFGGGKNVKWVKMRDFFRMDVETKKIEKKADMLTARTTHQLVTYKGLIYVYGGFDESGNGIQTIDAYAPRVDQWSQVTTVPGIVSKTWPQSLGFIHGKFYVSVFHTPNTFRIVQKSYLYDLANDVWSEAPVIIEKGRYCPTCCLTFPKKFVSVENGVSIRSNNNKSSTNTNELQAQLVE